MANNKLDFEGLAQRLLQDARALVEAWLPGGKFHGHEYVIGNLAGEPGESLSINVNTGEWGDFASGEKGGDLISLYAAIHRIGQGDAAKRLGAAPLTPSGAKTSPRASGAPAEPDRPIGRPPEDARQPTLRHPKFGAASASWTYRDAEGAVIGYVARYDPPDGRKQIVPWSWDREATRWRMWSFAKPRPLYGLELLAGRPEAPVLLVEGEKTADAARALLPAYAVMTWPGGAEAVDHVDWRPLFGRKVDLWPDADRKPYPKNHPRAGQERDYWDQPGAAAMRKIAAKLHAHCPALRLVDVSGVAQDGWDLADAAAEGWDGKRTIEWARARIKPYEPAEVVDLDAKRREKQGEKTRTPPVSQYGVWEELGLECTERGPVANLRNVLRVFERHPALIEPGPLVRFDEFHGRYFHRDGHEWSDHDELALAAWMQEHCRFRSATPVLVHQAAVVAAQRHRTNEPVDWMERLTWDGTERIALFFHEALGAKDSEYVRAASRNFWIGLVRRVYEPGCRLRNVVVLEGSQDRGKSFALAKIGGRWYAEASESVTSKDFYLTLQGKCLIEIAELDAFSRADVRRIKQIISSPVDRYRAPYARAAQDYPRRCIFTGSTNEDAYLGDVTGGTRFWPVPTGEIRLDLIEDNRAQLFAEAVAAVKRGEEHWHMPAEATRKAQESRRQADEWEEVVSDWLRDRGMLAGAEITMIEVAREALEIKVDKLDRLTQRRIAEVLRALGFKRDVAFHGKTRRVWKREAGAED